MSDSRDHLNNRQFMYHYSRPEHREGIEREGLKANSPFDPEVHYDESDAPHGVYMTDWQSAREHGEHGYDVWRVRAKGLPLHPDPDDQGDSGEASHYHPGDIPRERVSRVQGLGQ